VGILARVNEIRNSPETPGTADRTGSAQGGLAASRARPSLSMSSTTSTASTFASAIDTRVARHSRSSAAVTRFTAGLVNGRSAFGARRRAVGSCTCGGGSRRCARTPAADAVRFLQTAFLHHSDICAAARATAARIVPAPGRVPVARLSPSSTRPALVIGRLLRKRIAGVGTAGRTGVPARGERPYRGGRLSSSPTGLVGPSNECPAGAPSLSPGRAPFLRSLIGRPSHSSFAQPCSAGRFSGGCDDY